MPDQGSTWTLRDTRESSNPQSYIVKLMADDHYWMVQDLKFGDKCGKDFSGDSNLDNNVTTLTTKKYYGDCTTLTNESTPSLPNPRGYLYNWQAAINTVNGYYHGSEQGCSGTNQTCQGICPDGWHLPTGKSDGEYMDLFTALGCEGTSSAATYCTANFGFNASPFPLDDHASHWHGVLGGYCNRTGLINSQGASGIYWSSTFDSGGYAYSLAYSSNSVHIQDSYSKNFGRLVRCVRNY
jgi:uncharacterized protein (TIGR02145 family)